MWVVGVIKGRSYERDMRSSRPVLQLYRCGSSDIYSLETFPVKSLRAGISSSTSSSSSSVTREACCTRGSRHSCYTIGTVGSKTCNTCNTSARRSSQLPLVTSKYSKRHCYIGCMAKLIDSFLNNYT
ncbi:hypothetical protein KGM_209042 [Danaus plexippus plexippus]|uniref:Uncharacterized protein n=1 Tax=Danaus plexippus plexippus TaxID=278856 RepID=A0A212FCS3_DANPL|nr:hypothetical protein KGM_209042 [Danaus plexippus plexippus]